MQSPMEAIGLVLVAMMTETVVSPGAGRYAGSPLELLRACGRDAPEQVATLCVLEVRRPDEPIELRQVFISAAR
jgi:hypothetical protein